MKAVLFVIAAFCLISVQGAAPSNPPWANNNLAPFWMYFDALGCFFNQSYYCPANSLNQTGILYVTNSTEEAFCSSQCQNEIWRELACINNVDHYGTINQFLFITGANVTLLNTSMNAACANFSAGQPANFTYVVPKHS